MMTQQTDAAPASTTTAAASAPASSAVPTPAAPASTADISPAAAAAPASTAADAAAAPTTAAAAGELSQAARLFEALVADVARAQKAFVQDIVKLMIDAGCDPELVSNACAWPRLYLRDLRIRLNSLVANEVPWIPKSTTQFTVGLDGQLLQMVLAGNGDAAAVPSDVPWKS